MSVRRRYRIHGLILALHYEARFLKSPGALARANTGFENILRQYGAPLAPAQSNTRRSGKVSKE